MKISKLISISLLTVMSATCFVGCRDNTDTSSSASPSTSEPSSSAPYENEGIVKFSQTEVDTISGWS